jgi:transcription-repair coupling factor (superfamily II helicase)
VLYVPATQLDLVSKYIGSGEDTETKRLSKLGGTEWEKAKTKAKKATRELAQGLIRLYAERQKLPGHAFASDSVWQQEFEEQFEYLETEDQLRCIDVVSANGAIHSHGSALCGDVGYGKDRGGLSRHFEAVCAGTESRRLPGATTVWPASTTHALSRFFGLRSPSR